ncbi:MAG: helix-turn-helix domain-containing protein [Chitinophagaceae bacterium]
MLHQSESTLINQHNGKQAFRLFSFNDKNYFKTLQRNNFFTLIWVQQGAGRVNADFDGYDFTGNSLFTFAPYQPFVLSFTTPVKGVAIYFHFDFFCIHKHQKELELNGVLYNNIYQPPFVKVDDTAAVTFNMVFEQMEKELQHSALAQHELLVSYLKIFLITASRLKIEQQPKLVEMTKDNKEPFMLQKLKDAIEENFRSKHSPVEYADLLYISPKALAKMTRAHFNKTLSSLINERIIIEAKRELYLTDKTVKEIAYELGYTDEYYFSRFFKVNADVSPQIYRDSVGFGKRNK